MSDNKPISASAFMEQSAVFDVIFKHRRHVELSPGAGKDVQAYALAVIDDIEADLRRAPIAAAPSHVAPNVENAGFPTGDSIFPRFDCHYDGNINLCDKDCHTLGECKRRTSGAARANVEPSGDDRVDEMRHALEADRQEALQSSTRPMTREQIERMRSVLIESMTDSEGEYPEEVETIVDMALKWIEHGEAKSAAAPSSIAPLGEETVRRAEATMRVLADDEAEGKTDKAYWRARARFFAEQILRATHVSAIGRKECPYCTSDNEAIRDTYFDQNCVGCVLRMGGTTDGTTTAK